MDEELVLAENELPSR